MSLIGMSKPSESLTREDIENMRRGRKSSNNGNDWRYGGKRGKIIFIQVQLEYIWDEVCEFSEEEGVFDLYDNYSGNSKESEWFEDSMLILNKQKLL